MYKLKMTNKEFNQLIKQFGVKQKEIAEKIGVDKGYISQTANGRKISKLCAYALCKAISSDLEILDLFNIK